MAHNRYRSDVPSGENRVVDLEIAALRATGVDVVTYLRSSDEIDSFSATEKLALTVMPIHSRRAVAEITELIRLHQPDIVHLHNPYPLLSLAVVRAAQSLGVPVVQTVHNHRHSCMRGSYFRAGHTCQLCRGKDFPWPAVRHGCYRDSRAQSVPMAIAFRVHRDDQRAVDRYIALNRSVAESLLASGLVRPDQVVLRANSVGDPGPPSPPGRGLLFVGRLTVEKGLGLLLDAWERVRPTYSLTLAGDGPLRASAERLATTSSGRLRVLGQIGPEQVHEELKRCAAVVVPSASPEGFPLAVLEAYAHGRAVLATAVSGLVDAVDQEVGLLAEPTVEGMAAALKALPDADLVRLGAEARRRYEAKYRPEVVIRSQLEIYRDVLASRAR